MKLGKRIVVMAAVVCGIVNSANAAGGGKIIGELEGQVLATGFRRVVLLDNKGNELWQTESKNTHDVWKLANGNVLVADGIIREINPETDEVVFTYRPKNMSGGGAYACQRLVNGNTVVGENSTGRILELDSAGKIVFELKVEPFKAGSHYNLRMVRKLDNGNYLTSHAKSKLVREYTPEGKIVFEAKTKLLAFSAVRLPNGNTVVGDLKRVLEFDPNGKQVWEFIPQKMKGFKIGTVTGVNVLPNGNMVLGIYGVQHVENGGGLLEITRDKKIVWRYVKLSKGDRSMMSVQKLDASGKPISNLR